MGVINHWQMCEGYSNHFVGVRVSVCYHTSCYMYIHVPRLYMYVENQVPLGSLWRIKSIYCVGFIENTLFKSSGDIS